MAHERIRKDLFPWRLPFFPFIPAHFKALYLTYLSQVTLKSLLKPIHPIREPVQLTQLGMLCLERECEHLRLTFFPSIYCASS